jgi:hypothetical protein
MIDINKFLEGYIDAALWSTTDSRDEEGNDTYNLDDEFSDVSDKCRAAMLSDCEDFVNANRELLEAFKEMTGRDDDYLGHDFWLNREGHGTGFWDRGAGEVGDKLSDACEPYGSFYLYGDFEAGVVKSHHYG